MLRRLTLIVLVLAALGVPSVARAGGSTPDYVAQMGNAPLPCLGADRSYAGVISITLHLLDSHSKAVGNGQAQFSYDYRLLFSYRPNDQAQAAYSGERLVSHTVVLGPGGYARRPLALTLTGDDGSTAGIGGIERASVGDRGLLLSFGYAPDWTCGTPDESAVTVFSAPGVVAVPQTTEAPTVGDDSEPAPGSGSCAASGLSDLMTTVESSGFKEAKGLAHKLEEACRELGKGKPDHAVKKLDDFAKKVAKEREKAVKEAAKGHGHDDRVDADTAADWLAQAESVKTAILGG